MKVKDDLLFYFGYFLLIITDMFNKVDVIQNNDNIINALGYAFIIGFILLKNKNSKLISKNEIIISISILIIILISCFFSRNFLIFRIFILAFSFKYINFSNYLKIDLIIKSIATVILIVFPLIGIFQNNILLREDLSNRYSFGFYHPNALSNYIFFILSAWYYIELKRKNVKIMNIIKFILIPLFLLLLIFVTDSRSVLAITVIYMMYTFFTEKFNKIIKTKYIQVLIKNQFWIFTFISIVLIVLYAINIPYMENLDRLLSGRIKNYYCYFKEFGVTLFGSKIPQKLWGGYNIYLDSMFIKMLLNYGVIVFCIIGYFYNKTLKKMFKNKQYYLIIVFSLLSIEGLTDTNMILPTFNVFLLYYFFRKEERAE